MGLVAQQCAASFCVCVHHLPPGFGMMGRHGNIIEDLQEYRVSLEMHCQSLDNVHHMYHRECPGPSGWMTMLRLFLTFLRTTEMI